MNSFLIQYKLNNMAFLLLKNLNFFFFLLPRTAVESELWLWGIEKTAQERETVEFWSRPPWLRLSTLPAGFVNLSKAAGYPHRASFLALLVKQHGLCRRAFAWTGNKICNIPATVSATRQAFIKVFDQHLVSGI